MLRDVKLWFPASALFVLACSIGASTGWTTPITVQELGIGANETVYINSSTLGSNLHVYAGVVKLKVDGVKMDGFCIDPWHWSSSSALTYNLEPLADGPKNPTGTGSTGMTTTYATEIEQLWGKYYSPTMTNITAAALQIKIWELVDAAEPTGTFKLDSIDHYSSQVTALMSGMDTYLKSSPTPPAAHLYAVSGSGQDYVISAVPDAAPTLVLAALAGIALWLLRNRRRVHPLAV